MQPVVVDNTNVTREDRAGYIVRGKQSRFKIRGFFFESNLRDCLARNARRTGKAQVPERGLIAKYRKLEPPSYEEGFDELYFVRLEAKTLVKYFSG